MQRMDRRDYLEAALVFAWVWIKMMNTGEYL